MNTIKNVRNTTPLVHCITNYVTVNDCANVLLACGGSPVMADDVREAADITAISNALVINIGTLNARTVGAMLTAGKKANELGKVCVLDPVGAGASSLRTDTAKMLMNEIKFDIIRANMSEIKAATGIDVSTRGVDADSSDAITDDSLGNTVEFLKQVSQQTGAIIAVTGAADIITDGTDAYIIRNGRPEMSKITGTGCMVTAMTAAYAAANPDNKLTAVAHAVAAMGIAGELAHEYARGNASYRTGIIDEIYNMTDEVLERMIKIEKR